jgi:hypothetical protein
LKTASEQLTPDKVNICYVTLIVMNDIAYPSKLSNALTQPIGPAVELKT